MVAMVTGFLEKIWSNDSWRFIYVCGKFHSATINQTVFGKEFVKLVWENINYFEPPWKCFFCNFYSQLVSSTSDIARPIMFNLPRGTRCPTALALFKLTSRSSLLVRVKNRHLKPLTSFFLLGQLGALLKTHITGPTLVAMLWLMREWKRELPAREKCAVVLSHSTMFNSCLSIGKKEVKNFKRFLSNHVSHSVETVHQHCTRCSQMGLPRQFC